MRAAFQDRRQHRFPASCLCEDLPAAKETEIGLPALYRFQPRIAAGKEDKLDMPVEAPGLTLDKLPIALEAN